MCLSAPKIPDPQPIPERQAARSPDNGDPTARSNDAARRRIAMAASIFTQPGGLGAPNTTASGTGKLGA